jgi:hypothetical protein
MSKPHRDWKVLPHGPLEQLDEGILAVVGRLKMPLVELPRRMTVVRLRDGGLVVWSAIALDDAVMARVEAEGRPAFLVVPNDHHRLDAAAWKARYPEIVVVAPLGARDRVAEVVPVDTCAPDFADPAVRFVAVPGTRDHEAALVVHRAAGTTLVVNDVIANIRDPNGIGGWLLERMGFAGSEAQVPGPVKLALVKDRSALRDQLLQWAGIADLKRIVVAHGDVIDSSPQQALRELASRLD